MTRRRSPRCLAVLALGALAWAAAPARAARTAKPPLHGRHWMAITGKPLAATAGARMFHQGGNAADAAAAMLGATCTMWDVLSWGGETQALIWDPRQKKVIGLNALGVAPTGATPEFFRSRGLSYPPEYGPLAAVTPGTPAGLMVLLSEFGTLRLADVLAPAIEMADGYPIEAQTADLIERHKARLSEWPHSKSLFLVHPDAARQAPRAGEIFRQPDLATTLRKLVEAERQALAAGKNRREAIQAAYDRFYRGDIAEELVAAVREAGGLFTLDDLARWKWHLEEPLKTEYRGIEVYKLDTWVQSPVMLQALNVLEGFDLRGMGYNSARYIHTVYQTMNLTYADRDFYYGDPYFPPAEPVRGLLSKAYAAERRATIDPAKNDAAIGPGDPYPFQGETNPFRELLERWGQKPVTTSRARADEAFRLGTTSIVAAGPDGLVVSATPSGGWIPAVVAGRTGIGLSQRMQSFVLEPAENPFNVVEPGKRPRATLTPTLALRNGKPWLAFAVQGGDTQDQNLLQFFLNVVEFGMTVQQASEAANFTSFQMRNSFADHGTQPGRIIVHESVPPWVRDELARMGYEVEVEPLTSGPINAIAFDHEHGTLWGGSSHHGEDYGIAW